MSEIKVLAIDLAKSVFQLHGVDARGVAKLRKQVKRSQLLLLLSRLAPCIVAMEACGGAHDWARKIEALGHEVRLIPARYVKPFVKGNKTDRNDAEAICEAAQRPNMRFVPVKSEEQQSAMAQQSLRALLVKQRTALVNHIRGHLAEFGFAVPKGMSALRKLLAQRELLSHAPSALQHWAAQAQASWHALDEQIEQISRAIQQWADAHPSCRYLMRRAGIGVLTASALVAQIEPTHFKNGRHLSAFIGLVPKEHSTGGKHVRLGISKRGNTELRTLLIHGARAVLRTAAGKEDPLHRWAVQLCARVGNHKAIVAVANKMARYVWVDLMHLRQNGEPTMA
ncbi:MAG TPA: IS110 family transposase [Steroidobacteraceae bacterium]|nr:IS110 family transposase [Steroidobacteraceae bacterium]